MLANGVATVLSAPARIMMKRECLVDSEKKEEEKISDICKCKNDLALGVGAQPCLCLIGAVGLSLCVSVCLHVSLGSHGGGWVCSIIVVFRLCVALCVAFKVGNVPF